MPEAPHPFVTTSFRLQDQKESATHLDENISASMCSACSRLNVTKKLFGFCSDSPNVIKAMYEVFCEERDSGSSCFVFAYGCLCHELSNFIKDICKETFVKFIVVKTFQVTQPAHMFQMNY